jgi:hypothetical protein
MLEQAIAALEQQLAAAGPEPAVRENAIVKE